MKDFIKGWPHTDLLTYPQFKKDMDDIDNAEDEEPKAKRAKRSCRTKTRRGGSA